MGTTIHAHIEVKKNDKWLHYGCPDVKRDYLVFACINGMRKDDLKGPIIKNLITPVACSDTIPDDVSEVTRICLEQDAERYALKGFGVINCKGLERLQEQLRRFTNPNSLEYDLEEGIFKTYIAGNSIARHEGFDDVRVVFWYDN